MIQAAKVLGIFLATLGAGIGVSVFFVGSNLELSAWESLQFIWTDFSNLVELSEVILANIILIPIRDYLIELIVFILSLLF